MPAAIAIPALIGAGTQVAGAVMGSKAAKGAAKTQVQAAERAAGVQQQVYNDQRSLMQPYVQAGQSAVTSLGRLMQPGQPYTPQMQASDARSMPGAPSFDRPIPQSLGALGAGRVQPISPYSGGGAQGAGQVQPWTGQVQPQSMNFTGSGGPSFGGAQMVQLRSPDGEVRAVPAHLAQQFVQRGATLIGPVGGGGQGGPQSLGSLARMQ
jgi:hypothetical protein